ncbi:hypothetical protein N7470_010363 [Penicillium chermesinum]|nr:hypothetical protein N7470_010363 [Penicillium chermesinum]
MRISVQQAIIPIERCTLQPTRLGLPARTGGRSGPFPAPLPFESAPSNRRQSAMPFRPMSDKLEPRTGRERSSSEPLQVEPGRQQDSSGRRRAKPVLSRLITNF